MDRYFDRELSWIEFNARVLDEGRRTETPLLERVKFLAIVSSNFDEFFMVRVAGVRRERILGGAREAAAGRRLAAIERRVRRIVEDQQACLNTEVLPALADKGIRMLRPADYRAGEQTQIRSIFENELLPVLTPVRVPDEGPLPFVAGLRINGLFRLAGKGERAGETGLAVVQIPPSLDRFVWLEAEEGRPFALLEDVVLANAAELFPGYIVREAMLFRITRDADLGVDEERDEDFLEAMAEVLESRKRSFPVRLETSGGSETLKGLLRERLGLSPEDVYEAMGPLDVGGFMALASIGGYEDLVYPEWRPVTPPDFQSEESLWDLLKKRDLLVHHPYESFDPVVRMVTEAADDPRVLAIKMTLYRTSGDSPIVAALERAAGSGKQVAALVELKARFDEARNIEWAQRLERAGGIVVYGVAGLKVHAKALMVVRREEGGVRRYLHLGTGNYNDKTARLYTDYSLLTSSEQLTYEASLFFNAITGYSSVPGLRQLIVAPIALKPKVLELIKREAERSTPDAPGRIVAKMNSLCEPEVIDALYEASRAGVQIDLIIRGICTLVPGVEGMSENIRVVSVIDRYLEHSRVFFFSNGGMEEVYLASADWMPRNLERRVELMFPVTQDTLLRRLKAGLEVFLQDNTQAQELRPDGSYQRRIPSPGEEPVRSQEVMYQRAQWRAEATEVAPRRGFTVRRRPPTVSR